MEAAAPQTGDPNRVAPLGEPRIADFQRRRVVDANAADPRERRDIQPFDERAGRGRVFAAVENRRVIAERRFLNNQRRFQRAGILFPAVLKDNALN